MPCILNILDDVLNVSNEDVITKMKIMFLIKIPLLFTLHNLAREKIIMYYHIQSEMNIHECMHDKIEFDIHPILPFSS